MPTYALIPRIALTLLLGLMGGVLFFWLTLPLPWMLGALTVTLIAAVANAPIQAPERLRNPVVAIIGVLLGSGFTPELVEQVGAWGWSLGALAAYLVVAAALVVPYYRRFGGFDSVTAYFAGMPGGLTEMVIPPFLTGCIRRTYAAIFSFCAGVMPPMPMFGRSLL